LTVREVERGQEFDECFQEMTAGVLWGSDIIMAYPELAHPSALLANFEIRDDSHILAAFKGEELVGLTAFTQSEASYLPPSMLNRIFFLLSQRRDKSVEDGLLEQITNAYSLRQISEVSYTRLHPLEPLSPSGKRLGTHAYKKRWSVNRMARPLDAIPKPPPEVKLGLRRVNWEGADLRLFVRTWAEGFGWPVKHIENIVEGMATRLLGRNPRDPDTWINFLAETDDRTIGTAAILSFPDTAFVVNVSTLKECRRQGFATSTMMNLMEWCRRRHVRYMALDVWPRDTAAVNLYRKLNFHEYGRSAAYVKRL
jgi:ribosomal protein S18 acetylase RimI-like enzyme